MNSIKNLANRFIIENSKQNRAAVNGSGAKRGNFRVKAVSNILFRAKCCVQKNGGQLDSFLEQMAKKSSDN